MLATILSILGVLVPLTQKFGVPANVTALVGNLLGPVGTLLSNLRSGQSKTDDALAVLGAMQGVILVLKATPGIPQGELDEIGNIEADVQKALTAYVKAESGLDLTVYQQIATV